MKNLEQFETRRLLNQLVTMIELLVPEKFSISYLVDSTGKSRQALTQYLYNHYELDKDYHFEGKKLYVNKEVGIEILQRYKMKLLQKAA